MGATIATMQWRNTLTLPLVFAFITACSSAPSEKPVRADKIAIEAKAIAACECEIAKGKGESPDCWRNYTAAIEPFRAQDESGITSYGTACAPVSAEVDCLKDVEGEFCITTGYYVNGADLDERRLCRQAEAKAVENAINAIPATPGADDASYPDKAKRAAEEALAVVRASKTSRPPVPSTGCV